MVLIVVGLFVALVFIARSWEVPRRVSDLEADLGGQSARQRQLQGELLDLRNQLAALRQELAQLQAVPAMPAPAQWAGYSTAWADSAPVAEPDAAVAPATAVAAVTTPEPADEALGTPAELPLAPAQEAQEEAAETQPAETGQAFSLEAPAGSAPLLSEAFPPVPTLPEPESPAELAPAAEPTPAPTPPEPEVTVPEEEFAATPTPALTAEIHPETEARALADAEPITEEEPARAVATEPIDVTDASPATEPQPTAETGPAAETAAPTPDVEAEPTPAAEAATAEPDAPSAPAPEPLAAPTPPPMPRPRPAAPRPPLPPARPVLRPKPVPSGPTFWERASTILLENWTGILGAVVLVTGVGFLGIYAALRVSPQLRFLLICAFAGVLLGARFALRRKDFARKLNAWLLSSAAAIFLFACVGAVSIPGLRWATAPFDYLLLLAGVSANLYLAWRASRQEIATLHGVLSLVALAVLPPTPLTLGAAAGVTAFSIAITYRQQWKYQLLLSIVSFFAFHLYWHQQLAAVAGSTRLIAMALVLLVGGAAAVVQYRRVYAERRFEPLLFASHLLNWTCLGVNLYLYSTGSIWKTVPLALGAALTFWAGRQARRLGIGWLFQTDTILSLILGLATALSLQGWHATPPVILLFMLLETLLVALIMARQREALVYRVAMSGALLASAILLLVAGGRALDAPPATLYRDALVLVLAGWAGLAFGQSLFRQPLLLAGQAASSQDSTFDNLTQSTQYAPGQRTHRLLPGLLAGLMGAAQAVAGLLLARALFAWPNVPVAGLLASLAALAGISVGLAAWVQAAPRTPDWVRRQQLGLAQLFAVLAVAGLHEAHLSWPVVCTLLFAEHLGAVLLLARRDLLLHRAAMLGTLLTGLSLLLVVFGQVDAPRVLLYRHALLLSLTGWGSVAFAQLAFRRFLTVAFESTNPLTNNAPADHYRRWLSAFAGLGGLLQLGAGLLVARVLFGAMPAPTGLLLGALLGLAGAAIVLAAWVRRGTVAPGWVRWQQLGLAQAAVLTAIFGLHELGLIWSVLLLILFAENLLVAFLLAGHDEADPLHPLAYRAVVATALLTGSNLLLTALRHLDDSQPTALYREALLLALAGWLALALVQWSLRFPLLLGVKPAARRAGEPAATIASNPEANPTWLGYLAGLAGLLQLGTGGLLAKALTGWHPAPVGLLLTALLVLAAAALGLAAWVRAAGRAPVWVRRQQVVLGQVFIVLAIGGLHEWGVSWPTVLLVLYLETLVAVLLLARRDGLLHRAAMLGALAAGGSLLLLAATHLDNSPPALLYRDALLLALAGGISLAFVQATYKQLLPAGWHRVAADLSSLLSAQMSYLLHSFAGLAGLLQVGTGLLLARVLFGWAQAPVGLLLAALLGLALAALALAAWVRATGLTPGWVRRQQLVIGQFFVVLAIVGLHEVHLSWSVILALLFAENLLVATLLARRDALLHQAALAEALLTGSSLLLLAGSQFSTQLPPLLYRDALLLALAGWGSLAFVQFSFRQLSLKSSEPAATVRGWLSTYAGLAGFLQAGAGLLLGTLVFKWADTRALGLLPVLTLAALGLGYWVHRRGWAPRWVRRQQLVVAQLAMLAAVVGLHKLGLTWPAVLTVLYAENLLAALLLARRDEEDLLHVQTYLLVVLAALLPILVRSSAPGTLAPLTQAGLLLGAALLTLGYQLQRRALLAGAADYARLPVPGGYQLPLLGVAIGWLLLGAGERQYAHAWAGWAMVGLLGALLYLRQRRAVPGLWLGLLLAALGYVGLQWAHVLPVALAAHLAGGAPWAAGAVLLYLLPTVAVPLGGLLTAWWVPGARFVRWPWLYFLGAQVVMMLLASVPPAHLACLVLGLLVLAGAAFGAAQVWRRSLPDAAAVRRAGQPDRYLLHLCYGLLVAGLLVHLRLLATAETLLHLPAEYLTAAAYFGVLAALAVARPPATAPVYHSWRVLHPWLPEAALAFGSLTLAHHVRTPWLPLAWVMFALLSCALAAQLPLRFRRLMVYGRLYYWLAAASVSATCLLYLNPGQLLSADWWAVASAVALLFGYVALALQVGNAPLAGLSPAWRALAQPARRPLESALLYPALVALALFFIQSFDRSVLTVLLMLEVVAIFSASLLLRRQDLRYVALAGMLASLVRLVFFDLSRSGTVTRAIVFIFMGLLLLGMNALYARFKSRFVVVAGVEIELEEPEDDGEPLDSE